MFPDMARNTRGRQLPLPLTKASISPLSAEHLMFRVSVVGVVQVVEMLVIHEMYILATKRKPIYGSPAFRIDY
jgi:hypothetical protein